jgi:hypothetical protein
MLRDLQMACLHKMTPIRKICRNRGLVTQARHDETSSAGSSFGGRGRWNHPRLKQGRPLLREPGFFFLGNLTTNRDVGVAKMCDFGCRPLSPPPSSGFPPRQVLDLLFLPLQRPSTLRRQPFLAARIQHHRFPASLNSLCPCFASASCSDNEAGGQRPRLIAIGSVEMGRRFCRPRTRPRRR